MFMAAANVFKKKKERETVMKNKKAGLLFEGCCSCIRPRTQHPKPRRAAQQRVEDGAISQVDAFDNFAHTRISHLALA
jgi:hypothetical protein